MSDSDEERNTVKLPELSCENCLHRKICVALGRLLMWINQFMIFFQKMKLPDGVNPQVVLDIQKSAGKNCLEYRRDTDVLPEEE